MNVSPIAGPSPIIGQFISTLFASRTQAHIFHLQTNSFAAHKALNEYYDEIVDLVDGIAESIQGKYGIISGYSNVDLMEGNDCDNVIKYFRALEVYVERARQTMPQDSYIQNQIDEVVALIVSTIYKLKFLK
jgi:DNA-binding ferritin-like protein